MVSEPTPTTSPGLGVTPAGGSARAGAAANVTAAAATATPTTSLDRIRIHALLVAQTFAGIGEPPSVTRLAGGPVCRRVSKPERTSKHQKNDVSASYKRTQDVQKVKEQP